MTSPYKPIYSPWISGGTVLLALVGLWMAPVSPLALSRADVALGQGAPQTAVQRYDQVAQWSFVAAHRQRAQLRSAQVLFNELGDPQGALVRLNALANDASLPLAEQPDVQVKIAVIHRELRQSEESAHAFMVAVATCKKLEQSTCIDGDVGAWKISAAQELAQAGHLRRALNLLARVVREHPEYRQQANLERAQLQLIDGHIADALTLFEDVATGDDVRANVAKLGVATCLERLGNLDEALAELDEVDLPEAVRESRTEPMRSRAQWRNE